MEIEIYADIVFLVNWFMDFVILWAVGKLKHKKPSMFRLALSSLFMALSYCLLFFVAALKIYYNVFASLLIVMIGTIFAFKPVGMKDFLMGIVLCYAAAFMIGGMGIAFLYYANIDIIDLTGRLLQNFSFKILIASSIGFYLLLKLGMFCYGKIKEKKQIFFQIKIYYDERHISLNALLDTGNSLHDPLSNAPVIIAEFGSVEEFLPDKLRILFHEKKENNLQELIDRSQIEGFLLRMRMIPYASLGKQNGMLLGFRPDKIEIESENGVLTVNDVIIGIYNNRLSGDGVYQVLLNPDVLAAA